VTTYRTLLADRRTRRLLTGLGASSLGDGISTVTIAWLAISVAPADQVGLLVGLALAAYTLPGAIGAIAFASLLRGRSPRTLVLIHCLLRTSFLGLIAVLSLAGSLTPSTYVALLAGSSLMSAWGNAGEYTLLSELGGPAGRLAVNSLASAQVSFAVIVGPSLAGLLLTRIDPGWLLAADAASFAFLGLQAWRTPTDATTTDEPVDTRGAESGFRLLRRSDLLGLIVVTWLFFFLYGPVEVALPVYVALRRRRARGHGHHRHPPRPQPATGHAADRRGLGRLPAPVRLRPSRCHARLLRGRRPHLWAFHPAHVRTLPIRHDDRQPPERSRRTECSAHRLDTAWHRGRRPHRREHRRC
jgi:hypothetical protein